MSSPRKNRQYYSERTGKNSAAGRFDLAGLLRLFRALYYQWQRGGFFQEYLGIDCTDGHIPGKLGPNMDDVAFRIFRRDGLFPVWQHIDGYTEEDIFDVIEFLFDHCSAGVIGDYHSWNDCGKHFEVFDRAGGQQRFRAELNDVLRDYSIGYELSENGEILELPDSGMAELVAAPIPNIDPENVTPKIEQAQALYRRRNSTLADRHNALRQLADVLEFLRPQAKEVLTKSDENDLFAIVNNFGIRHHRAHQKTDYDTAIFYSWLFYYYLASIHACMRLIERGRSTPSANNETE